MTLRTARTPNTVNRPLRQKLEDEQDSIETIVHLMFRGNSLVSIEGEWSVRRVFFGVRSS